LLKFAQSFVIWDAPFLDMMEWYLIEFTLRPICTLHRHTASTLDLKLESDCLYLMWKLQWLERFLTERHR
jgi:hypothetical protein